MKYGTVDKEEEVGTRDLLSQTEPHPAPLSARRGSSGSCDGWNNSDVRSCPFLPKIEGGEDPSTDPVRSYPTWTNRSISI
jgi:hypothetical protein